MAGVRARRKTEREGNQDALPVRSDTAANAGASDRLDDVVLSIARLIGRRMAREDFAAHEAALSEEDAAGARRGNVDSDDGGEKP